MKTPVDPRQLSLDLTFAQDGSVSPTLAVNSEVSTAAILKFDRAAPMTPKASLDALYVEILRGVEHIK
jgi:hypothetical protein